MPLKLDEKIGLESKTSTSPFSKENKKRQTEDAMKKGKEEGKQGQQKDTYTRMSVDDGWMPLNWIAVAGISLVLCFVVDSTMHKVQGIETVAILHSAIAGHGASHRPSGRPEHRRA